MNTKMRWVLGAVLLCLPVGLYADAGFIALEGSDATAFHHDPQYTPQLFSYLQGASSLPVLILGFDALTGITGGVATTTTSTLTGKTLSDYSAIYIESPGGCCTADNTALNGFGADVLAFIAAGGNLSIENYVGGGYDGVVPGGAAAPAGSIQGSGVSNGGVGGGPDCTDGELVTAFGLSKGFTQPPIDGCWSHQGYQSSYWEPFGYASIMASAKDSASFGTGFTFADGTQNGSSFLALGGSLGGPPPEVPEPSTVVLLGGALAILVAGKKRFASR